MIYTSPAFSACRCHGKPTSLTLRVFCAGGEKRAASPAAFSHTHQHMCSCQRALLDSYWLNIKGCGGICAALHVCKTHEHQTPPDSIIHLYIRRWRVSSSSYTVTWACAESTTPTVSNQKGTSSFPYVVPISRVGRLMSGVGYSDTLPLTVLYSLQQSVHWGGREAAGMTDNNNRVFSCAKQRAQMWFQLKSLNTSS